MRPFADKSNRIAAPQNRIKIIYLINSQLEKQDIAIFNIYSNSITPLCVNGQELQIFQVNLCVDVVWIS